MRIVFLGTPEFAVASLEALIEHQFNVVAVVTAPDKPSGRGLKLTPSPVKTCAEKHGIPVLQPIKLKDPDFIQELASFQADLQFVVAFRMLPEVVWNMPPAGTYNLHGSLLPKYRGAAPIHWAVMNGDLETGVTVFKLKHEIDTGDIILRKTISIGRAETTSEVHDRMMLIGAEALAESAKMIENQEINYLQQREEEVSLAPKLFKETCLIDWSQSTEIIYNKIRGLAYFPGAYFLFQGKTVKLFASKISSVNLQPGDIKETDQKLLIGCLDGSLEILEIQVEGKRKMEIGEFLRGNSGMFRT
jgi:methionyl-tRNA formyltransferase